MVRPPEEQPPLSTMRHHVINAGCGFAASFIETARHDGPHISWPHSAQWKPQQKVRAIFLPLPVVAALRCTFLRGFFREVASPVDSAKMFSTPTNRRHI
jgi:hypothetical protein